MQLGIAEYGTAPLEPDHRSVASGIDFAAQRARLEQEKPVLGPVDRASPASTTPGNTAPSG
jgi:hypothetical protein